MGRVGVTALAAARFQRVGIALLSLCWLCTGCDNSCVAFVSNPSGGNISISTSTCHISTQIMGNVRVRLSAPAGRVEAGQQAGIEHVFVTPGGVEGRLSVPYGEAAAGWQDLAPELKKRPVQIDLMQGNGNPSPPDFLSEGTVPAGEYAEMRMVLMTDTGTATEPVVEENGCGDAGLNCVVKSDGDIRPLAVGTGADILIFPGGGGRSVFRVFPGTTSNLDVELNPDSSALYMVGGSAWFNPAFVVRCDFAPASGAETHD